MAGQEQECGVYMIGAEAVAAHMASGDLVHDDAFARHVRATLHLDAGTAS